jgi:succinate dehydrogenase / fumarate reductase membrane anchor subunit
MVTTVTNLGRSGLSDWLVQRVTAVVRVFSLAALLSIVMHAWIGLWCVATDYLTGYVLNLKLGPFFGAKANILRLSFLAASAIVLFTYVVWGIQILWG